MRVDVCDFRTLVGAIPLCHNAMFASRHAYEVVGLYDLSYKIVADAHWVHRAIRAGMRFTPLNARWYIFTPAVFPQIQNRFFQRAIA